MTNNEFLTRLSACLGYAPGGEWNPKRPSSRMTTAPSTGEKTPWLCLVTGISNFRTGSVLLNSPAMTYSR